MTGASAPPLEGDEHSLEQLTHELQNLVGVVIGFADLILRDLDLGPPHRGDVLEIKKAGESAALVTARIMEVIRSRDRT